MAYSIVKWLHVLSAIVAVGANATYGIWLARASSNPGSLPFTLRSIKVIDDRMANPAYGLLLITGGLMIYIGQLPLGHLPWLITAITLFVILVLLGALAYTPALKRQIELLDNNGPDSPKYQAAAQRQTRLGILLGVIAVIIVFLMVVKPPLWGTA
jgi:hypothetical protein